MGWNILLYLGKPLGYKVMHPKHRRLADDGVYISDGNSAPWSKLEKYSLEKIIGEPYSLTPIIWMGAELDELISQINQLEAEWKELAIKQILKKIKHPAVEEWMEPLIENELNQCNPLVELRQFISLLIRAKTENGMILMVGD